MPSVRRAITAFFLSFFLVSIFLFSINVVISSFIECMPVESPFPPPFPQNLCVYVCVCVCVCLDVQARVSVCE